MENPRNTKVKEYYVRCPNCDKLLMQVASAKNCKIKCWGCNIRYIINVQNGGVSVEPISNQQKEDD